MKFLFVRLVLTLILVLPGLHAFAQKASSPDAAIPDWSKLKTYYSYDHTKPPVFKTEQRPYPQSDVLHLEFNGPAGEKVTGLYAHPKGEGLYPCVLLLHGLTSNKETMAFSFGAELVKQGFAFLALDAPLHGERKQENTNPSSPENFTTILHDGCREYRVALDWLATRKEIDSERMGLIGYSMGSFMGSIVGGVDGRVKAFVLCVGGDPILPLATAAPENNREIAYSLCPSLYIGHIAGRPVLMLNGRQDTVVPEAASKRLYTAAKEPKEQIWYDTGHLLPTQAIDKSVSWMKSKLKPRQDDPK